MMDLEGVVKNEPIFSCDMTALSAEQLVEHTENSRQLLARVQNSQELSDGYLLQLPVDTDLLLRAGRFIALERLCCPWHGFTLELVPEASSFWLRLTGPEGVKAVLMPALAEYVPGFIKHN